MRCACAVVLSNRGLPHLRNGADWRRRGVRPRAAGSARKGRRADLLLPTSGRGGARPMMDGRKDAKTASAVLSSCQLGIVTTFPRTVRVIEHAIPVEGRHHAGDAQDLAV